MNSKEARIKQLQDDLDILLILIDFHAKSNYHEKRDYIDVLLDELNLLRKEIERLKMAQKDED